MLSVGVGTDPTHKYRRLELEGIASDPNNLTFYDVPDMRMLPQYINNIVHTVCDGE